MSSIASLSLLVVFIATLQYVAEAYSETQAQAFLDLYNENAAVVFSDYTHASWRYSTNLTQHNRDIKQIEAGKAANFSSTSAEKAKKYLSDVDDYSEPVARELNFIAAIGTAVLDDEDFEQLQNVLANMSYFYATGKVCKPDDNTDCHAQDPYLTSIMANSRDYAERLWVWEHWRNNVGRPMRQLYSDYVTLKNKASVMNGYEDYGDYWRGNYEDDDLEEDMEQMYEDIKPLYEKLHAYVRYRLKEVYGDKINLDKGCLPANVLGDMWGRFWNNLYSLVEPYSGGTNVDVTDEMKAQNYTVDKMFHTADDFFTSMGLAEAPPPFWEESMFVKPTDRLVECHATAWDFSNAHDFRVRMCTEVNMDDLMTIHHEMGHIQYYLQYKHLPIEFRSGANEGFHEAVGEVIAMSAATPEHLYSIGLMTELPDDYESDINFLMKQALTMVATLPFSIALEKWRWEVFRGNIPYNEWTKQWWEIKNKYAGVVEPVRRTEDDFEPGAMFHIANDYSFLRYYTRTFIQFQFYKAMCDAKGWDKDIFKCDFYNSTSAGKLLSDMLALGRSVSWPDAMEAIAGTDTMESGPLLAYFKPLDEWLTQQLDNLGLSNEVGWDPKCSWKPYHVDSKNQNQMEVGV
uniref:Angiotensin-converting enzyme n=1 Tax=Saccoglossus kowalevskii TaxID=10224 RepID=A0ABM0GQZ7_SACKO|nr:PREDICTED: angiotensin-converting enzyme-like [Saccoglossus kowalevskii]